MMLRHNQSLRVRNDMDVEADHAVEGRILESMTYMDMNTTGTGAEREAVPSLDVGVVMVEAHEKAQAIEGDTWLRRAKHL
jgi:hypothetical protein